MVTQVRYNNAKILICTIGPSFGEFKSDMEVIFERIARAPPIPTVGKRQCAVVDHGNPANWYGKKAEKCIACETDDEVVNGLKEVPEATEETYTFVFARLTELADGLGCKMLTADSDHDMTDALSSRDNAASAERRS